MKGREKGEEIKFTLPAKPVEPELLVEG